ncbi:MAG: EF-P lysine aminoacylase GenX [Cellvibrionales bacterium TMED148]|nr:elongation factor P lysine(34) lysyltransferase [Porticoccaceae bacterium]RPG88468.1 MAG: EF-P lysine aminoacylase GenX [Cellvibrionales bacterium TMED148]
MIKKADTWKPGSNLRTLKYRSFVMRELRRTLSDRGVLEIDVPLLGRSTVTDPQLLSFSVTSEHFRGFLQTSPEYFMKRLLASGSGDIFSLGKAFRAEEEGTAHNPEFTMLEWYRINWDEHQLAEEVIDLVSVFIPSIRVSKLSYGEVFEEFLGINPHNVELSALRNRAEEANLGNWSRDFRSGCLDVLFETFVRPNMPKGLVVLYDYPSCQKALAQLHLDHKGQKVSRRFEVFLNNSELANGYFELNDFSEHQTRFKEDRRERRAMGKSLPVDDKLLLDAVKAGLPNCAGVALGVDRLLVQLLGAACIDEIMSFSWARC